MLKRRLIKSISSLPTIRNLEFPVCANCLHYIPPPPFITEATCKKFGKINVVSGVIDYDIAILVRGDEKKCGMKGAAYEEKIKQ
jgi:hypothetical protein